MLAFDAFDVGDDVVVDDDAIELYPRWSGPPVQPEGDPGHHHYQAGRNVHLEIWHLFR